MFAGLPRLLGCETPFDALEVDDLRFGFAGCLGHLEGAGEDLRIKEFIRDHHDGGECAGLRRMNLPAGGIGLLVIGGDGFEVEGALASERNPRRGAPLSRNDEVVTFASDQNRAFIEVQVHAGLLAARMKHDREPFAIR